MNIELNQIEKQQLKNLIKRTFENIHLYEINFFTNTFSDKFVSYKETKEKIINELNELVKTIEKIK